jgi:hypothetical protein
VEFNPGAPAADPEGVDALRSPGLSRPAPIVAGALLALVLGAGRAGAVTFQVDFTVSTYQVVAGQSYADLLAQHQSEPLLSTTSLSALSGVAAPLYAGVNTNYSVLMTTVLDVTAAGVYQVQVGTDWGRGGASVVIDNATSTVLDEYVNTTDIWWNNDWNNPDVFVTSVALAAGSSYTLGWVGFEGCCGGPTTVRFSYNGSPFQVLSDAALAPYVAPEPGTAVLVGLGLLAIAARRRAR